MSNYLIKYFESKILKQTVSYSVYLPQDFNENHKYPVIYGFHGVTHDHDYYKPYLDDFDEAIQAKRIHPFIFITPSGKNSFFINTEDDSFRFEDFFFKEFISHVESTYPIDSKKEMRALFGISMGGYAAAYYSLQHPELFSVCIAMSPALIIDSYQFIHQEIEADPKSLLAENAPFLFNIFGPEERFLKYNFNHIVKSHPIGTFKIPMYVTIGTEDYLYKVVIQSKEIMQQYQLNYIFEEAPGIHDIEFWKPRMKTAFSFISKNWISVSSN